MRLVRLVGALVVTMAVLAGVVAGVLPTDPSASPAPAADVGDLVAAPDPAPLPPSAAEAITVPAALADDPGTVEARRAAGDALVAAGMLDDAADVLAVSDHNIVVADRSPTPPVVAVAGPAAGASTAAVTADDEEAVTSAAVTGNGYSLIYDVGLLDRYAIRGVYGTPRWVVDQVIGGAASAAQATGVGFDDGGWTGTATPNFAEMTVQVVSDSPCFPGQPWVVGGCTITWYDGSKVTKSAVQLTAPAQSYYRAQCILTHEVGHALGLGHVNDTRQIMNPFVSDTTPCDYSWGDRAGLSAMASRIYRWGPPFGYLDGATQAAPFGQIRIVGWAADPDAGAASINVRISVDGVARTVTANVSRPDVAAAYPGIGDAHGYDVTWGTYTAGAHTVCVTAVNVGAGNDAGLGCTTVTLARTAPAAPPQPTLEAGDAAVTVRSEAPSDDGGAAVTGYVVRVRDAAGAEVGSCASSTPQNCVVAALAPGAYTATVTASNAVGSTTSPTSAAVTVGPSSTFHPVTPTRIRDSRDGTGLERYRSPWGWGVTRTVSVVGTFGAVTVPAEATAVVLNVTATDTTAPSFLTLWPSGAKPTVSSLNWSAGETVPNAVVVPVGPGGTINVYNHTGSASVVADLVGFYTADSSGDRFVAATAPTRILDSRDGTGLEHYTTPWSAGTTRPVSVTGTFGSVTVPSSATAVVLNVTATDTTGASYATVSPHGAARPTASSLNWVPGDTRANQVTVPVGDAGQVDVFNLWGSANIVVDIVGWYETPVLPVVAGITPGTSMRPLPPTRIADSRSSSAVGTAGGYGPGSCRTIKVTGRRGTPSAGVWIPTTASAVAVNVTATNTFGPSFLTVYPAGQSKPLASTLNWAGGDTRANAAIVGVGTSGSIVVCNALGWADVVVDVVGYTS